jgi:hypothetical protein
MQFLKFIECRIGEPITALDIHKNFLLLGSISGYYAIYNISANITIFSEKCEKNMIRDCCLHIGAKRKFRNPPVSDTSPFNRDKEMGNSLSQNEDSVFDSNSQIGKSSLIFKEASEMVFEYENKEVDLAYLAVADSGVLRVDVGRFFRERLTKNNQSGKVVIYVRVVVIY